MKITKKHVEEANLKFFRVKAKDYNKEEPSYKPENIRRETKLIVNFIEISYNSHN